jgi:hypothetical protein
MGSQNIIDEGSPAMRTRSAPKNRLSDGNLGLASEMALADISGMLFAEAGTNQEINDHSPLRAGDNFDMEDEPPGSGGSADSDHYVIVPVSKKDSAIGDADGVEDNNDQADKREAKPIVVIPTPKSLS